MVLTHKVGQERNYALVVLLVVVTLGIYGIYWHYKAHDELFKQFELEKEGRDQGVIWFVLGYVLSFVIGFVGQILLYVYLWMFVGNVRYVRERLGFEKSLSAGGFLALLIGAGVVVFIGIIVMLAPLIAESVDAAQEGRELSDEEALDAIVGGIGIFALFAVISVVMQLVAYGLLQSNINEVWRAYDRRAAQLAPSG